MILFPVVFTAVLLLLYVLLLIFYRQAWFSLQAFEPSSAIESTTKITVVVAARNEAQNIPHLLDSLCAQTYPKEFFEVIVVDDHSSDNTAEVVQQHQWVKVLRLQNFVPHSGINSYKKKAIEVGIQHARGELIVTTDADCIAPVNWLSTIAAYYETDQRQLIVMPVKINCDTRAIEIFQALDFMALQGITAAAVNKNVHSMCNGANLAYTREAFYAVDGFAGIDKVASGDDMLLMHKVAVKYPHGIGYLKASNVIVDTAAVRTVKEFFQQRIRWASKADQYEDKKIFAVLVLVYLLNVCLLFLPVVAAAARSKGLVSAWFLLLIIKTLAELLFLLPVARFFKQQNLLAFFPLAQPFHIVYTVIAGWLGKFGNYSWKDRTVK